MTSTEPETAALAVLDLARTGRFADIRDRFTPSMRPLVSADVFKAAWDAEVAQLGPLRSVGHPSSEPGSEQGTVIRVPVHFERGERTLQVSMIANGELTGLQFLPVDGSAPLVPWEPPPYADPDRFDEPDVILGEDPLAVPGTLTLPRAAGPLPALVLLGGSGPFDRDSTIGKSKPFKDLAWGLACRGIAVLRFDKVTYAHPRQVEANRDFTVVDEYLPHARAAVELLRAQPTVDPERVFLAGHSLGGTISPRIAAADLSIAGLIILAGGTQPLQWAAVRQVRYIASLDPATAAAAQPAIDAMTALAETVDSPELSPDTPDDQLPFGTPAPYWLDLRDYDPVATAAAFDQPILICHGERDYQASMADDFAGWQAGLHALPNVTIRTYPADNHFFLPGAGPSSPAELAAPHHLDPQLITDINDWMAAVGHSAS